MKKDAAAAAGTKEDEDKNEEVLALKRERETIKKEDTK